jgi:two-component system, NtrC family, nitrogen regulation sensor histidine kinase NtrY
VRQIGLSTLGLLTFLLIFASSWTAFYIARGLTVPIKALAEGADEIAHGNFAHRVEVLAEDELALLVTAFNQMSARLEANSAELSERRKYIETVLQSLSTGVISFDAANRVTTINKAAKQILRLEDANFENFALATLVSAENLAPLEKLLSRAWRIGTASEQTILFRENADERISSIGESIPVALTATALPNRSGTVLVIEDLTELLNAQRASAWAEVARRMAHEIKNPLTPIQLSAERIAKRFKSQVPSLKTQVAGQDSNDSGLGTWDLGQTERVIKDGTETILREVGSLKSMVDEFSRFARLPNVKLESGDLNAVARQSVALYNAIEAFDPAQTDKKITVSTIFDAGRDLVVAEIADNGGGISPPDFQKLFQPYFSTKGRGTGLGLAIVQRIVIEHGGKIRAANNPSGGASFVIELPAAS